MKSMPSRPAAEPAGGGVSPAKPGLIAGDTAVLTRFTVMLSLPPAPRRFRSNTDVASTVKPFERTA
jgi:hypothetical protein